MGELRTLVINLQIMKYAFKSGGALQEECQELAGMGMRVTEGEKEFIGGGAGN
ncbi:MAG: hypothetical protein IME96_10495 [Proteobacteria bacterium]|nr:hypothetical protein [Pseudomonadota bacterium]